MAGNRRQKVEDFDVSEFLRPNDEDMKSALSSILRATPDSPLEIDNAGDETAPVSGGHLTSDRDGDTSVPTQPVPFPQTPPPSSNVENTGELSTVTTLQEQPQIENKPKTRIQRRGISPVTRSFNLSHHLRTAKALFKLNRSELALYEMFLGWTHAIGLTTCQATNRKICETSGIELKTVRRNLSSLKERNLIIQISAYDPHTHAPSVYEVHLPILAHTASDK
jgi:hypothetical protein